MNTRRRRNPQSNMLSLLPTSRLNWSDSISNICGESCAPSGLPGAPNTHLYLHSEAPIVPKVPCLSLSQSHIDIFRLIREGWDRIGPFTVRMNNQRSEETSLPAPNGNLGVDKDRLRQQTVSYLRSGARCGALEPP